MSIATQQHQVKHIPLSSLVLSKDNMRQIKSIEKEFVESLYENGVIQPLIVAKHNDGYEVAGGRRRLNALNKLATDKRIDKDFLVPCLVSADGEKLKALSLVENLHRRQPHATEFYTAIKRLAKAGMEKLVICQKLQITALKYDQIMRLSNLHSKIFKAFANGDLSDDQVKAFAATDNKRRQIEVWEEVECSVHIRAQMIRSRLVSTINSKSPIALFVGMDAYKDAKGKLTIDLFGDVHSIHDADLMKKLAHEKLEKLALDFQTANPEWAWVVSRLPDTHLDDLDIKNRFSPKFRKQTADQKAHAERLTKQLEKFDHIDCLDMTPEQDDQYEHIEQAIEQLRLRVHNDNQYYLKKEMRYSGVVVTVSHAGHAEFRQGLQSKADIVELKKADRKKDSNLANRYSEQSDSSDHEPESVTVSEDGYSQALRSDIRLYRRAMLKVELLKHPDLATELLNYSIVVSALNNQYYGTRFHEMSANMTQDETTREDYESSKMCLILGEAYKKLTLDWLDHESEADKIEGFISLTQKQKKSLLSYVSAITLESDLEGFIETETAVQFRDYFVPDQSNYFGRVPKNRLLDHMAELTGEPATADDQNGTRKLLAEKLTAFFVGKKINTTWLPPLLRSSFEE